MVDNHANAGVLFFHNKRGLSPVSLSPSVYSAFIRTKGKSRRAGKVRA